jgi:hypothetical protein
VNAAPPARWGYNPRWSPARRAGPQWQEENQDDETKQRLARGRAGLRRWAERHRACRGGVRRSHRRRLVERLCIPTFIALASGANDVLGMVSNVNGAVDRDYFTVTVPTGMVLSAINVLPNTALVSAADKAFVGLSAGVGSPAPPPPNSMAGLIGYAHFQNANIGSNLLPAMGSSAGLPAFTPPLGAGNYSFWVQDTTAGTSAYGFQLVVTSVPEPTTTATLLAGLLSLGWLARRRRQD